MKIGFIGLGNVGAKLSASLLRNGYYLTVLDSDPAAVEPLQLAGAQVADSAKSLAEDNDIIITCLPSPRISAEVLEADDGVIAGLGPGKIWMEMSSTDAEEVRRLGRLVEAKGADVLDSPVSGGCHRATTGNITIFAGGRRETFERVLPLLATMGRNILHTGELGTASIMKVATNYLAGVQLISTGEAFMVAKKAGIDLGIAYEAIRISSGNSFVHETEGQLILNGSEFLSPDRRNQADFDAGILPRETIDQRTEPQHRVGYRCANGQRTFILAAENSRGRRKYLFEGLANGR